MTRTRNLNQCVEDMRALVYPEHDNGIDEQALVEVVTEYVDQIKVPVPEHLILTTPDGLHRHEDNLIELAWAVGYEARGGAYIPSHVSVRDELRDRIRTAARILTDLELKGGEAFYEGGLDWYSTIDAIADLVHQQTLPITAGAIAGIKKL